MQEREQSLLKREAALERAHKEQQEQLQSAQVGLARLEHACQEMNRQLNEAEADYLTGTERLAELQREVSNSRLHAVGRQSVFVTALSRCIHLLQQICRQCFALIIA